MKNHLLSLALVLITLKSYAVSVDIYKHPNLSSVKVGTFNTDDDRYKPIFTSKSWTEVVDSVNGRTGWVKNNNPKNLVSDDFDFFNEINNSLNSLLEWHKAVVGYVQSQINFLDTRFDKSLRSNTQKTIKKYTKEHPGNSKFYFKSISVRTNGDGTATVVKKTKNGNNNITEQSETIPVDKLSSITF